MIEQLHSGQPAIYQTFTACSAGRRRSATQIARGADRRRGGAGGAAAHRGALARRQPDLPARPAAQHRQRRLAGPRTVTVRAGARARRPRRWRPPRAPRRRRRGVDAQGDHARERRVAELLRASPAPRAERRVVVRRSARRSPGGRACTSGCMTRPGRSPRPARPATCVEQLERPLRGAKVGQVSVWSAQQHADQRHAREVVALGDHLRADQDVDLAARARGRASRLDRLAAARGVAVQARHARVGKALAHDRLRRARCRCRCARARGAGTSGSARARACVRSQ